MSGSQQKYNCLSKNVWTKESVSLKGHFNQCTIKLFFFFYLLYRQGSLKIIIHGAGEGMVKLAHSHIAGGRGKSVQPFWEEAWPNQELRRCFHLLTHNCIWWWWGVEFKI